MGRLGEGGKEKNQKEGYLKIPTTSLQKNIADAWRIATNPLNINCLQYIIPPISWITIEQ